MPNLQNGVGSVFYRELSQNETKIGTLNDSISIKQAMYVSHLCVRYVLIRKWFFEQVFLLQKQISELKTPVPHSNETTTQQQ